VRRYKAAFLKVAIRMRELESRAIEMFSHHNFEEGFAEAFGYELSLTRASHVAAPPVDTATQTAHDRQATDPLPPNTVTGRST
jgi:hypothetical protein